MPSDTTASGIEGLNEYVEGLLEEKGMEGMEPAVMEEYKKDLLDRIVALVNGIIVDNVPDEKLDAFEELMTTAADQNAIEQFCRENILGLDNLVGSALVEFKKAYLAA